MGILLKSISDESTRQTLNVSLLERLYFDYPGDVGCFCIYFFNYIILQPGEAVYLGPNEPHAYISGGMNIQYFLVTILKFRNPKIYKDNSKQDEIVGSNFKFYSKIS